MARSNKSLPREPTRAQKKAQRNKPSRKREVALRGLTFALSGAPPPTQAKRALLIGASALERGVRVQIFVARASHTHSASLTAYIRFGYRRGVTPAARRWSERQLSLSRDRPPIPRPLAQAMFPPRRVELQHRQPSRRVLPFRPSPC